jgi:hypothetical protein
MPSISGKIEVAFSAEGRDEETVRRFYDQLGVRLAEEAARAGDLFSGIRVTDASSTPAGMTVRK